MAQLGGAPEPRPSVLLWSTVPHELRADPLNWVYVEQTAAADGCAAARAAVVPAADEAPAVVW